jgi:hypothetical protein
MLVFLCALQSRAASKNWDRVAVLCDRTIASLCAQAGGPFKVVLICNDVPLLTTHSPHLEILRHDFPLPEPTTRSRMEDKFRKLGFGAYAMRQLAPAHFMTVDADDCVSNRLAPFVEQNEGANGWYVEHGYLHEQGAQVLFKTASFHTKCGTSSIVRCTADDLPRAAMRTPSDNAIVFQGHTIMKAHMEKIGRPLAPLPFPGVIYEVGTGENDSGTSMRRWPGVREFASRLVRTRWLTARIRSEFGYQALETPANYRVRSIASDA